MNNTSIIQSAMSADVIGVDEGQFFDDICIFAEHFANMGKTVIISALDGTYQRKPFGKIPYLVCLAEEVVKLQAVCQCGKDAAFTKRISDDTEEEVIGGQDKYVACCRTCFDSALVDSDPSQRYWQGLQSVIRPDQKTLMYNTGRGL